MTFTEPVVLRQDSGSGKILLFIHGWLMSGRVWSRQFELADRFRLITIDLPGHGLSDAHDFSYSGSVESILRLLDRLGIEKVCPVGWSMGSQIALELCNAAPDRLSGMVLVAGTPRFTSDGDYSHGLPESEARGMALRIRRNLQKTSSEFFSLMFAEGEVSRLDLGQIAREILARVPDQELAAQALAELAGSDMRTMLPEIKLPVLLIHGDADRICPSGASQYMHSLIPGSEMAILPGTGHAPFLTRAGQFNSLVAGFVETVQ